ncbi:MAG TPA: hypothetical protein DEA49_03665 [Petrotoga sp.]|nr:hypothetical protein [Petrotoga sp.]
MRKIIKGLSLVIFVTLFSVIFSENYFHLYPVEYDQTQNIVKMNLESYVNSMQKPNVYIYDGGDRKKLTLYEKENGYFTFYVNLNAFKGDNYSFLVSSIDKEGEYISQFFASFLEKGLFAPNIEVEITTSVVEKGYQYYLNYYPEEDLELVKVQVENTVFEDPNEFLRLLDNLEDGFHDAVFAFRNRYGILFERKVTFLKLAQLVATENVLKPKQRHEIYGYHIVQKGESLYRIAEKYNVLPGDLVNMNDLKDPSLIYPGQALKIGKVRYEESPLRLEINLTQNKMYLYFHDQLLKTYIVAVGMSDYTPPGYYRLSYKEKDPALYWYDEYIPPGSLMNGMGTRWLQLSNPQYGIHGTTKPWEIGKRISHGCIRMFNFDVEVIDFLAALGTEVYVYNGENKKES